MKLVTYTHQNQEARLGFIFNDLVIDMEDFGEVANFPLPDDMLDLIEMGMEVSAEILDLIAETPNEFIIKIG
ncbi:MAG: FAA hydrolase family protein, partial [Flavobacterium sp.]